MTVLHALDRESGAWWKPLIAWACRFARCVGSAERIDTAASKRWFMETAGATLLGVPMMPRGNDPST